MFDAEVAKCSRSLDLALLQLSGVAVNLPAAPVGDSDALRVGELVYAIGHPWGWVGAVSAGIVGGWASFVGAVPPRATCVRTSRSRRVTRVGRCSTRAGR